MSLGRFAIYTAVFGDYDYVPRPRGLQQGNPEYFCFTDNKESVPEGWNTVEVKPPAANTGMANRHLKLFPHLYLPNFDTSLYIDANVALRADPRPLIERYLDASPLAIPRHPIRDCVYEEARACVEAGKAAAGEVENLLNVYNSVGLPRNLGLSENFFIARRHHDPRVIELAESLWRALEEGPTRDQLHLPYLLWKHSVPFTIMQETARDLRWLLRRVPHQARHTGLQRAYYWLLARHFHNGLGRFLEAGIATYNSAKGVDL